MRWALATVALLLFALAACGGGKMNPQSPGPTSSGTAMSTTTAPPAGTAAFAITSSAFGDNAQIPAEYTCRGRNVPPPLRWQNVPPGTQSLAVVVDDPDAPAGLYVHWVVSGIPPSTTAIGVGPLPQGSSVSRNSAGKPEYLGPCPPAGTGVHHYRFQLYASNKPLTLAPSTPAPEATQKIANAAIAHTHTVGLFGG